MPFEFKKVFGTKFPILIKCVLNPYKIEKQSLFELKLIDMFGDNVQTRLLEHLLENPSKVFTQAEIAREMGCSPSSVSRVIELLKKERVVMVENVGELMKAIALNVKEPRTDTLIKFYSELKRL